jgi:hypothetical protein
VAVVKLTALTLAIQNGHLEVARILIVAEGGIESCYLNGDISQILALVPEGVRGTEQENEWTAFATVAAEQHRLEVESEDGRGSGTSSW